MQENVTNWCKMQICTKDEIAHSGRILRTLENARKKRGKNGDKGF